MAPKNRTKNTIKDIQIRSNIMKSLIELMGMIMATEKILTLRRSLITKSLAITIPLISKTIMLINSKDQKMILINPEEAWAEGVQKQSMADEEGGKVVLLGGEVKAVVDEEEVMGKGESKDLIGEVGVAV
jgi:hypothetical protein